MGISTNLIIAVVLFSVLIAALWYFSRRAAAGEVERMDDLREAAERGDIYSQFRLGQLYFEGKHVARDDVEAAKWFLKAAQQDHSEAQFILASLYEKGTGVKCSDEEAFRWYIQAATQGHERATFILEADKWNVFKKRHLAGGETHVPIGEEDGGDPGLGHQGLHEEHKQSDVPPAGADQLEKYLVKARAGDMDAQYNLGIMYYHGEGVEKDHDEALKWFHLAAEQNDAEAQYNLGFMYGRGEGGPKNHRLSMEWFQRSAAQGHAGAREILEKMFKKT
jgi:TPR repeat protein